MRQCRETRCEWIIFCLREHSLILSFCLLSAVVITHIFFSLWTLSAILSDHCHQNNHRGCVMKTVGACRHKEPQLHPVQSRSSQMSRGQEAKPFPLMMTKQSAFMKRVTLRYYQHISRTVFVSRGVDVKSEV